ncbi:MAG: phytoene/squalene synthase family protein [Planctomycetaceae bacterium]|nr:phytoene/squalene synthase family protein [Planctomycetaceae bacterium]
MTNDAIEASYDFCRRVTRRARSSFHAGFLLLPSAQRRAMWAIYAFMRHTDDLADGPTTGQPRRALLATWRAAIKAALQSPEFPARGEPSGRCGDGPVAFEASILPAVADTVRQFHIPHEHLFAVLDGVEMDLDGRQYTTFDDLKQYCERVASAVGLCCIYIWGFRGPEALLPARQAGIALQLTNILRDLKEDASAGRVYLPADDLRQCEYSADDLRAGVADDRFRRLMAMQVARAETLYSEGAELLPWLAPPGKRIFGLLMATYHALLREIARQPEVVFHRRLTLGPLKRLQLLARWSIRPPLKGDLQ